MNYEGGVEVWKRLSSDYPIVYKQFPLKFVEKIVL